MTLVPPWYLLFGGQFIAASLLVGNSMETVGMGDFNGTTLLKEGDWSVCFGADWCPYCRAFRKLYKALDGKDSFKMAWGDLTDMDSPLWDTFSIEVVPTVLAFRNGRMIWRRDGTAGQGLSRNDLSALKGSFKQR